MEKEQNYFVINKYSDNWDNIKSIKEIICFYDNNDHISLKPSLSYRVNKIIDVNLVPRDDKIQNIVENERSNTIN